MQSRKQLLLDFDTYNSIIGFYVSKINHKMFPGLHLIWKFLTTMGRENINACKLKTTEAITFRLKTFSFSKSCESKDMTKAEQEVNRSLVLEFKKRNIKNDPSTRWVIKFGRVQAEAHSLVM